jgi:hypothetical protein
LLKCIGEEGEPGHRPSSRYSSLLQQGKNWFQTPNSRSRGVMRR